MARMTAQDMVNLLRKGISNVTSSEWLDVEILRFVNLAVNDIAMDKEPEYLEESFTVTTTVNVDTYDVPSTIMHIKSGRNVTRGMRLKPTARIEYDVDTASIGDRPKGDVYRWFESGENSSTKVKQIIVQLVPTSVQELEMIGLRYPVEAVLTPSPTEIDLPQEYDHAVLERARLLLKSWDVGVSARDVGAIAGDSDERVIDTMGPERRYPIRTKAGYAARHRRRR
jgi:hypothetical protein